MKYAQDYLADTASGECRGGFNSRLQGESFGKCIDGISQGFRWGQRCNGWTIADGMIREGKIFSMLKTDYGDVEYKCYQDGDAWCCVGEGFVNLQESDNFTFGDTREEAIEKFISLQLA